MKEEKKGHVRTLIEKGVPLLVGFCASAVTSKVLGQVLPEPEKLMSKVVQKIGSYGIGLVVANAVEAHVEREVKAVIETVEPIIGISEKGSCAEQPISEEELEEIKARIEKNRPDMDAYKAEIDGMIKNLEDHRKTITYNKNVEEGNDVV